MSHLKIGVESFLSLGVSEPSDYPAPGLTLSRTLAPRTCRLLFSLLRPSHLKGLSPEVGSGTQEQDWVPNLDSIQKIDVLPSTLPEPATDTGSDLSPFRTSEHLPMQAIPGKLV